MRLLFDENLSPRLAPRLADLFPDSTHVRDVGLKSADDPVVWDYARLKGFLIVSKDADIHDLSLVLGNPPKVIWLRLGNCSTTQVEMGIFSGAARQPPQSISHRSSAIPEVGTPR